MTEQRILLVLFCTALATMLAAQSGIGVIPTNNDFALHIKTSSGAQDPLRLEGLRPGNAETSVLVTDANGKLSYRPAADLFSGGASSSLWSENNGDITPTSNRAVGIGQANVDNSLILGVTGNQRMSNQSQIQFRNNQNYIFAQSINELYFVGRQTMSFRDRNNSRDLLTVRADRGRVGLFNTNPRTDFEVSGTQLMTGDEQLQFRDGTNYINSPGSNNNWYFHGQQYVVFRDRNDAVDILTVQANNRRVGILNRNPQVDFEVSGTQRMTNDEQLQFGSTMNYMYARSNQDLRIHGFTETNFMSRGEAEVVMNIDANTRRVGIGTNDPSAVFHVDNTTAITRVGGGIARFGNRAYLGLSQNQIGVYDGNATAPLHLQQFGNSVIIGASNPTRSFFDARGRARIGVMPEVGNDAYIVTANIDGDLRNMKTQQAATLFADNLGNHTTTQDLVISPKNLITFTDQEVAIFRSANDLEITSLTGDLKFHGSDTYFRNELGQIVAIFDGANRRVGFGTETAPAATIHIDPANTDFPIRIEDVPSAGRGSFHRLLIDASGYIYKSRTTFDANGIAGGGTDNPNYRGRILALEKLSRVPSSQENPIGKQSQEDLTSVLYQAVQELTAENVELKADLAESQRQQETTISSLEAKLATLTNQMDKLYKATGQVKEGVNAADKPELQERK